MDRQCSAYKRLLALYRLVLWRMRADCGSAQHTPWARVEWLQPRILMSLSPSGTETLINQVTGDEQELPAVAADSSGNIVAAWQSQGQDGSGWGIYARRFNSSGTALGNEFLVNQTTAGDQTTPAVASDAAGDFVITWVSGNNVYARAFNADGTARTGELLALAQQPNGQDAPAVAMDSSGNFAVVSDESSNSNAAILLQRFTASGTAIGSIVVVNTAASQKQLRPTIAMDGSGAFVVAWTDQSGGTGKIEAQRFDASGTSQGAEFLVGTIGGNVEDNARVGLDSSGNFTVTWQDNYGTGSGTDIYARRYNASGTALDVNPVLVNTTTSLAQQSPSLAELPDGEYLVTWQSQSQDGSNWGVFGQTFNADGTRDGGEIQINTTTTGSQQDADAAWGGSTAFVIWDGQGATVSQGILAQSFVTSTAVNQAPIISSPYSESVPENATVNFSSASSNAIAVSDPDGGTTTEQITLRATNGTLTLASTTGLTFVAGTGTGDTTTTVDGSLANLNAAMNGLVFSPSANFSGSASLQITADDEGNTGTGGAKTVTTSVAVTVTPVAHTPDVTNSTSSGLGAQTQSGLVITPNPQDASLNGYFQITGITNGTLYQNNGTTAISNGSFITFAQGEAGLKFSPPLFSSSTGSFSVQASTTNTVAGLGGSVVGATITVSAAPVNNVPGPQTVLQDVPLVLSAATGNGISISDTGTITLSLSATNGSLSFGDGSTSISGTLAQINAKLDTLIYTPNSLYVGSAKITVQNTSTALLIPATTTSTIDLNVIHSAHTPYTSNASTYENVQSSSGLQVTENVADWLYGDNFKITDITGGALFQNDGVTQINDGDYITPLEGLVGLTFSPTPNSLATGSFVVQASTSASDSGLGGSPVTMTIAVNAPPAITLTSSTLAYTEGQGALAIDPALTVSDGGSNTLAGATVQLFGYVAGEDTLAFTNQNGITGSWNTTSGVLTLSGTASLAQYQTALRSITYADSSGNPTTAARYAQFTINDGALASAPMSRQIQVTAVNTAPTIAAPSIVTSPEDTAVVFLPGYAGTVTVADVDANGANEVLTLTAVNGTINIGSTSGLAAITGNGTASLSLTGTVAALTTAMSGMQFTPSAHFTGPASIGVTINDQGNTGTGGAKSASATINLTINPVAHTPTVTNASTRTNQQTTSGLVVTPNALDGSLSGYYEITGITGGSLFQANGTTTISSGAFITFAQGAAGLKFTPTNNSTSPGEFTIQASTSASSAGLGGSTAAAVITVTGLPAISLSSGSVTFTEKQAPVAIDPGMTLSDPAGSTLIGATVTLSSFIAGEDTLAFINQNGITGSWDAVHGVLTLSGTVTLANYQTALRSVTYSDGSSNPTTTARTATFVVSDAGAASVAAGRAILVVAVNDPPTVSFPISAVVAEESNLTLSTANSNAITVADVDADGGSERVTLTATNGALTLATTSGLTSVSGNSTASVSFTGSITALNTALNGLEFVPTSHYFGAATVGITINDQGNTGTGGAQSASGTINLTVTQVAHTPTVTNASTRTNQQTTSGLVITPSLFDGSLSGYFEITAIAGGTLYLSDGVTAIANGSFITFAQGSAGLKFTPTANSTSPGSFALQSSLSSAASGLGGSIVSATITVSGPPVVTPSASALAYTEGQGAVAIDPGIVLSDPVGSTLVSATVQLQGYVAGEDSIGFVGQNGITGSWNAGTTTLTLSGSASLAHYETALRSVTYSDGSSNPSTTARSAQFTVSDGGASSAPASRAITVTAVNTAPTIAAPASQSLNEDTTLVFSSSNVNAITVADVDANGGVEQVTLASSHGTLNLATTTGLSSLSGNETAIVAFSGTLTTLNAAMNGLQFIPTAHYAGAAAIAVTINDQGNTGTGGAKSASGTVSLTVNPVAHTPTVTNASTRTNQETTGGLVISPNALDGSLSGYFQITGITGGTLYLNDGVTAVANGSFISFAQGSAGLKFAPSANATSSGSLYAQASVASNTGGLGGSIVIATITVVGLPVATPSAGALAYTEGQGAVAIDPGLVLSDPGGSTLVSATVRLQGYVAGQDSLGFVDQNGITGLWNAATATLTLSGSASLANYQTALRSVTYSDSSNNPATTARAVLFTVSDSGAPSVTTSRAITVTAVNNAPTIAGPSAQPINEDTTLTLSSASQNAVTVADVDANGAAESLTLSATHGTVSLATTSGLNSVSGNGTSSLSLTGTLAALNASMDGLQFIPAAHYFGAAAIGLVIDDLGNTGIGGALSASDSVAISVNQVAHTPSVANGQTNENVATPSDLVITPNALDGSVAGYFKITGILGGVLFENDGITPISDGQYITFAQGQAGLSFTPAANSIAAGSFVVQASLSDTDAGLGGATASAVITVLPVPTNGVPGPQSTLEDTSLIFSSADGNPITASDPGNPSGTVQISLSVTGGTLTLGHRAGVTFLAGTGIDDSSVTFSGTFTSVNRAFDGLKFTPADYDYGGIDLTVTSTEGSNSNQSDIAIDVQPVTHTPVVTNAPTTGNSQTTDVVLITPNPADASLAGYFEISSITDGSLFQSDGVTPINSGDFITFSQGQAGLKFSPSPMVGAAGGFSVEASTTPSIAGKGGAVVRATVVESSSTPGITFPSTAPDPIQLPVAATASPASAQDTTASISDAIQVGASRPTQSSQSPQKDQPVKTAASIVTSNAGPQKSSFGATKQSEGATLGINQDLFSRAQIVAGASIIAATGTQERFNPTSALLSYAPRIVRELRVPETFTRVGTIEISQGLAFLNRGSAMWHELDSMKKRMVSDVPLRVWAGSASVMSMGVSVVYLLWIARAGSLLSSLLSSMPAWRLVDPLPILDHLGNTAAMLKRGDDDGLERLINDASGQ